MRLPIDLACGDLIAFSGEGFFSEIIKLTTDWPRRQISHVGVMLSPTLLCEATSLLGENGVTPINLSWKLESYPGAIYACPLSLTAMESFDPKRFIKFMMDESGRPYSKLQACLAPLGAGHALHNWASSWYCSKIATVAYKEAGVLPWFTNEAQTPSSLTKLPIFNGMLQLKGGTV
jgi:hypothetical protein